ACARGGGGCGIWPRGGGGGGGVRGPAEGGISSAGGPRRYTRRARAAGRLLLLVWAVRRRRGGHDRALLLEDGRRPLRRPETSDLVGDAARHSHRRRSRRHPVRNHDRDRIRWGRRRWCLPAGVPGEDARLETHQGSGVL